MADIPQSWSDLMEELVAADGHIVEFRGGICRAVLGDSTVDATYFRQLLTELGYPQPEPSQMTRRRSLWRNPRRLMRAVASTSICGSGSSRKLCKTGKSAYGVTNAESYTDIITKPLVQAKFEACREMCAGMQRDLKRAPWYV